MTIYRIFKGGLILTGNKEQFQQLISADTQTKPLNRSKVMIADIKHAAYKVLIWSKEILTE